MSVHALIRQSFSLEEILALAMSKLTQIARCTTATRCDTFLEVRTLLEALPLSHEDFAVASHRLDNAQSYFKTGEIGAGKYEIRLLKGGLADCV